mmetsp:Transcript_266/g.720  ORF Transcript_266/g.720 Transcript_266/m.720 type:complete len:388 (-) Transcript_266:19-1182(-)
MVHSACFIDTVLEDLKALVQRTPAAPFRFVRGALFPACAWAGAIFGVLLAHPSPRGLRGVAVLAADVDASAQPFPALAFRRQRERELPLAAGASAGGPRPRVGSGSNGRRAAGLGLAAGRPARGRIPCGGRRRVEPGPGGILRPGVQRAPLGGLGLEVLAPHPHVRGVEVAHPSLLLDGVRALEHVGVLHPRACHVAIRVLALPDLLLLLLQHQEHGLEPLLLPLLPPPLLSRVQDCLGDDALRLRRSGDADTDARRPPGRAHVHIQRPDAPRGGTRGGHAGPGGGPRPSVKGGQGHGRGLGDGGPAATRKGRRRRRLRVGFLRGRLGRRRGRRRRRRRLPEGLRRRARAGWGRLACYRRCRSRFRGERGARRAFVALLRPRGRRGG